MRKYTLCHIDDTLENSGGPGKGQHYLMYRITTLPTNLPPYVGIVRPARPDFRTYVRKCNCLYSYLHRHAQLNSLLGLAALGGLNPSI